MMRFKVKITFISGQVLNLTSPIKPSISDDASIVFVKRESEDHESGTMIPMPQIRFMNVDRIEDNKESK